MKSDNYKNEKTRFRNFNIPKLLNSKMGELKKNIFEFFRWKFFKCSRISRNLKFSNPKHMNFKILNFRTIEPFVSSIFEFIIFGLLNFKNVEIHIFELTWPSIGERSNQF